MFQKRTIKTFDNKMTRMGISQKSKYYYPLNSSHPEKKNRKSSEIKITRRDDRLDSLNQ